MILLAEVTKDKIQELNVKRSTYIEQVKALEHYTITDKERLIKSTRIKEIQQLNWDIKQLNKRLHYQVYGNGIQKTYDGEK